MSDAFIVRRGGGAPYAVIGVRYPEGSVCTCTDGARTFTARDTSGLALFQIPSIGTWTVTITDGSRSRSAAVPITAEGQNESVELSYELVLFDNGNYDQETGGWEAATSDYHASYDIAETTPELIVAKSGLSASGFVRCYTKSKVDLTEIKTIVFNVKFSQTNDFYGKVGIANTQTPDFTNPSNFVAYKSLSVSTEYIDVSIDVSSLSGSYYVVLGGYKGGYGQINCKKILGERL